MSRHAFIRKYQLLKSFIPFKISWFESLQSTNIEKSRIKLMWRRVKISSVSCRPNNVRNTKYCKNMLENCKSTKYSRIACHDSVFFLNVKFFYIEPHWNYYLIFFDIQFEFNLESSACCILFDGNRFYWCWFNYSMINNAHLRHYQFRINYSLEKIWNLFKSEWLQFKHCR